MCDNGNPCSLALEEGSSKTVCFAVYQKQSSIVKQAYLKRMSKKESKRFFTSTIVVSPDLLSPFLVEIDVM